MTVNNLEIPLNATIRQKYVKCGNPDCQNQHGPYLYAYWKKDTKLNKRYVGKNLEAFRLRQIAREIKLKPSLLTKVGEAQIPQTIKFVFSLDESFDVGRDTGTPVTEEYKADAQFRMIIKKILVDLVGERYVDLGREQILYTKIESG